MQERTGKRRDRQILDSITEFAVIVTDRDGLVTDWNAGAEQILGWTREDMVGRSAEVFFTEEDRANGQIAREMSTSLRTGRGVDERWHLRRDGTCFWASGEMMPLRDESGEHLGFVKVLRDRTDQHRAGLSLEIAQDQLRLALSATNTGIFDYDLVAGVLVWDKRTRDLFGLDDGEDVDYDIFLRGLHPEDRGWVNAAVTAALDPTESGAYDIEYRVFSRRDGLERWVAAKGQAFFRGGAAVRFIGTTQDVTEHKRAAHKLAETEERLRLASKATNDAIWDWSFASNHVLWNDALEAAYGHVPSVVQPTGNWWIAHIHPDDRVRIDESIHAMIDGTASEWTDSYRFLRADGSYAPVLDRGQVIRDGAGRAVRMIGAMLDLTQVQKIEGQLKQSERRLLVERGLLQAVIQQAPLGIAIAYADGHRQLNGRLEEMLGRDPDPARMDGCLEADQLELDADPRGQAPYELSMGRSLRDGESVIAELVAYQNPVTSEVRRWEVSSTPIRDDEGRILAAVSLVIDVEERRKAEERQTVLNHELAHRLKNTLAVVQSIATQTLRSAPDMATARDSLMRRIQTLSKAHDVLLTGESDAGSVEVIIRSVIELHDPEGRIALRGAELLIGPKAALTLSLIVHELATNASKYGALSVPGGRVHVAWVVEIDETSKLPTLALMWREIDGPPTSAPTKKGFGTRLIEMGLSGSSGGSVDLDYAPDGLRARIVSPLTELQAGDG